MAIQLKDDTALKKSSKTFDVSQLEFDTDTAITIKLEEVESNLHQKVNVEVKAVAVDEQITFASKQVTVADSNALAEVVLWEENVGKLEDQCSYFLKNLMIREYGCSRFLGFDRDGSEIVAIADIGSIKQIDGDTVEQLPNAQIIAVIQLDEYRGCLWCKSRVEPQVYPFGRCSRAGCENDAMIQ